MLYNLLYIQVYLVQVHVLIHVHAHLSLSLLVEHSDEDQLHTGLCVWGCVRVNVPVCVCAKHARMCVCVWVGGWVGAYNNYTNQGFFSSTLLKGTNCVHTYFLHEHLYNSP